MSVESSCRCGSGSGSGSGCQEECAWGGWACLRLVEEGLLSLDDKVEKFVPEVKGLRGYADHPPITVRQVLTVRQPSPRPSSALPPAP